MRGGAVALVACALASAGCGPQGEETSVRLGVRYEASWALTGLEVSAGEADDRIAAAPTVLVRLPDAWDGQAVELGVVGLRGDAEWAAGRVTVVPQADRRVDAEVTLARLPCGAWCTAGAIACQGDGAVVCEERDADGCLEWSEPIGCPAEAPACSFGTCDVTCVDECAAGGTRCDGPGSLRQCGQADGDACLDWLPALACGAGETCSLGQCRPACLDECAPGAVACLGGGTVTCGDLNFDGCLEWGPVVPCPDGESCSSGACSATCADECTASETRCDGTSYQTCGNYDLDVCTDWSPGTSCVPADPCWEGACTADGCASAPRVCEEPPGPSCVDGDTLRVHDAVGVCTGGECTYASQDVACPDCPACDACTAVTCDTPPSVCYATPGTCEDGACSYPYADEASCDDGNACTTGDDCLGGVCAGTPVSCTTPPAPVCVGAVTRRVYTPPGLCTGGACSYPYTDATCPSGACSGGACTCTPEVSQPHVSNFVFGVSIGIDSSHRLHAYDDAGDGVLFSRTPGGSWSAGEAIDLAPDNVSGPAMAVDGAGGVHIAYAEYNTSRLKYAYRAPGDLAFARVTVDTAPYTGGQARIAVESSGTVHIAYTSGQFTQSLKYARRAPGGTWELSTVDSDIRSAGLAVDGDGKPHVVYQKDWLTYAYRNADGSWTIEPVTDDGSYDGERAIAVDVAGGVHIGFTGWAGADGGKIAYAYKPSGGTWSSGLFDATGSQYVSITVFGTTVHMSYYDGDGLNHLHGWWGGSWFIDPIDPDGTRSRIIADSSGTLHVAYVHAGSPYGMKYARICP